VNLYFRSVGRNAKLLLNVPPTKDGVLHPTDVERLMGFADRRRALFAEDVVKDDGLGDKVSGGNQVTTWLGTQPGRAAGIVRLEEDIEHGQRISSWVLSAATADDLHFTTELARGSTVGYARLERFAPKAVTGLRLDTVGGDVSHLRLFA
jgi:alpha-L-fucosidase